LSRYRIEIPAEPRESTTQSAARKDKMPESEPWKVYRQDDNGNRFLVRSFETEEAAKEHAAELESHGHKQLYWVSRHEDQ
jgi:hypothetical protein